MYVWFMPRPRILLDPRTGPVHYHCLSRVVDRRFVFGVHERDVFRKIMRQVELFSGLRVVTWTILSNHFHLLLEVPPRPDVALTDDEILDRCRALYSSDGMRAVEWEHGEAVRMGEAVHARWRDKYLKRMWDLSEFMKTLKQKFTLWFNTAHDREGTLWERRFKSILVEGSWKCLLKVAAYIDLNAVRAGLVADPKDYRWCGYSEAVAGDRVARRGLVSALGELKAKPDWRDAAPRYRKVLFGIGEENAERPGISRAAVEKVFAAGGQLTLAQLLRCRVRHFADGLAVGSESFIERVFATLREAFSERRSTGARSLPGGDWEELRSARDLRVDAITLPDRGGG